MTCVLRFEKYWTVTVVDQVSFNPVDVNFRHGAESFKLRAEISKLMNMFDEAGALEIQLPSLIDSGVLIDLYGEDIRNRAYTTANPMGEKKILRPDFTVPIVQMHIVTDKTYGKYSYSGPVWRSQPQGSKKPSEYFQVGLEYFHETDSSTADAEVFELFQRCTSGLDIDIELGDMGIIRAIVNCLDISENKRRLLLRHLWRPVRFKQLLEQLSMDNSISGPRATLFQAIKNDAVIDYVEANGPVIGQRSVDDIIIRSKELLKEELKKPISQAVVSMIEKIQQLKCSLSSAPSKLSDFLSLGEDLGVVKENLEGRIQAMAEIGIEIDKLNFATNLSRTSLEYYDGFIFSISIKGSPHVPPLAQGGRYNALTKILGKGANIPAVGGIIRPEILLSQRLGR